MIRSFRVFGQFRTEIRELDPGIRYPKLGQFLSCLFGGILFEGEAIDLNNIMGTYIEHYLVWTQRITPPEARVPIVSAVLGMFFDNGLKRSVRGKRFAMTREQHLALVPDYTDEKHLIAILLGSDYPLVVQLFCKFPHNGELRVAWNLLGPAFIPEIMEG